MRDPALPEEPPTRGLTLTEERVAALAADGRTNAEIAGEVGLTRSAVAWHLWRVYRKLGVNARSELPRPAEPAPGGDRDADTGRSDRRR
ncbi:MAG TPA: helix-turn-helix transcriptional regulator [Gaiellaceae bacterium]